MTAREHPECPSCICGRRAPVQGGDRGREGKKGWGPGAVAWWEHLLAWSGYAKSNGRGQSAERMADRGGFGYGELTEYLGHEPTTWEPRGAASPGKGEL